MFGKVLVEVSMNKPKIFWVKQGGYDGDGYGDEDSAFYSCVWSTPPDDPENYRGFHHMIEKSAADELAIALEFALKHVKTIGWIAKGPEGVDTPMFLGTLAVEGDLNVHEDFKKACSVLQKYRELK